MLKFTFGCTLSLILGAGISWFAQGYNAGGGADPGAAVTAHVVQLQTQPTGSTGIGLAQLHNAIREELSAVAASQTGSKQPATSPAPVSAELMAQRREALREIQDMVAGGSWGDAERISFHRKLDLLDPQQAQQALQELMMGLNNGTIQVQTNSPL